MIASNFDYSLLLHVKNLLENFSHEMKMPFFQKENQPKCIIIKKLCVKKASHATSQIFLFYRISPRLLLPSNFLAPRSQKRCRQKFLPLPFFPGGSGGSGAKRPQGRKGRPKAKEIKAGQFLGDKMERWS